MISEEEKLEIEEAQKNKNVLEEHIQESDKKTMITETIIDAAGLIIDTALNIL